MAKAATAKTEQPKQEVAAPVTANQDVALSDDPFDGAPSGLEHVTSKDLLIPRLTIVQALSPQVQPNKPEYNKDAQQGDFVDTGTGDLFKGSILLLPVFYARLYLEWFPRASGKGIAVNHGINDAIMKHTTKNEKGFNIIPSSGNVVEETATYFVLNLQVGGRRSFVPMSRTQLRAAKGWMTSITSQRVQRANGSEYMPPIYYRAWKGTSVMRSNNDGSWYVWKFEPGEKILDIDPSRRLLAEAIDFAKQAAEGKVMGDVNAMAEEHASEEVVDPNTAAM